MGYAVLIALASLGAFAWGVGYGGPTAGNTMAFMALALAQIFHLGNARREGPVLRPRLALRNQFALAAVAPATGLQLFAAFFPPLARVLRLAVLAPEAWAVAAALALLPAVTGRLLKMAGARGRAES